MARTAKQQAALKKAQAASAAARKARKAVDAQSAKPQPAARNRRATANYIGKPGYQSMSGLPKISAEERARRKKERPFDLAYQAGQVSLASRGGETVAMDTSAPWQKRRAARRAR